MNERMERITRQALGRWRSHRDGEDLAQEARIAFWQSESDPDALLIVKVRRRAIDAWRRMTRRREQLVDVVPDSVHHDVQRYDAGALLLPPRWTRWTQDVADGAIDGDDVTAEYVRIFVEENDVDLEDGER